jgi:hypothetical protein
MCVLWTWYLCSYVCVLIHGFVCCGHVSMYTDMCAVGMFLCTSVCTVVVCPCAQSEYVFLGLPDICMILQKSQSCPGQESVSVRMCNCVHAQLCPSGRLSLVHSHLADRSVTQCGQRPQLASSTSWTGPYHELSYRICAVSAVVSFADGETEAVSPGNV